MRLRRIGCAAGCGGQAVGDRHHVARRQRLRFRVGSHYNLGRLAGSLIDGFDVGGFWSALFGSVVYSLISWALSALLFKQKAG